LPQSDPAGDAERRLARAAEAWLPAQDRDARTLILAFLREVKDAGADPIAEPNCATARGAGSERALRRRYPRRAASKRKPTVTPSHSNPCLPCGT
jgi:hypothetical protein